MILQGTLNAPGGPRATCTPPHEPQRRTCAVANKPWQRRRACAGSDRADLILRTFGGQPPNVLELTRARPVRSGGATQRVALTEPRKRRAQRRPGVGGCDEVGGAPGLGEYDALRNFAIVPSILVSPPCTKVRTKSLLSRN